MRLNDRLQRLERAFAHVADDAQPVSAATPAERLQTVLAILRRCEDCHPALIGLIAHAEGCVAAGRDPEVLLRTVFDRLRSLGLIPQR
jgi:hypothetical protein